MGINIRIAGMAMAQEILVHNPRMKALGWWQSMTGGKVGAGGELNPKDGTLFEVFCGALAVTLALNEGNQLYVVIFATKPEWQGRGCGSALLRFLGDVADADNVSTYLETAGARNCTFYAKKGGFQEVARSPIVSSDEDRFVHEGGAVAMTRPAGGIGNSGSVPRVVAPARSHAHGPVHGGAEFVPKDQWHSADDWSNRPLGAFACR